MFEIIFTSIHSDEAQKLQEGQPDAYGRTAERYISDGESVPCRHCLDIVGKDQPYILLSYRPFPQLQPYAETGPIFLHQSKCRPYRGSEIPPMLKAKQYILRAYDENNRIVSGSGRIILTHNIKSEAIDLFQNPRTSYLHIRSASNNCYHCRIDRVSV